MKRLILLFALALTPSIPAWAITDSELHATLSTFCEANKKDTLVFMSFTCKLAKEKISIIPICDAARANTRQQLKLDEVAMNYSKATGKEEELIRKQLCMEAANARALAEKPLCDAEAAGTKKIQRKWWNGADWIATEEPLAGVQKSAAGGDAHSLFNLGYWYEGGAPCMPQDHQKAVQNFCLAYDKGFAMANIQLVGIGKNEGFPADKVREGLGKRYGCSQTAHQKELAAEDKKLADLAKQWKTKADKGDLTAQYKLGLAYMNGDGIDQNKDEAAKWIKKAADRGHTDAMEVLGGMYNRGDGVPEDDVECFNWYIKAAKKGSADAQYFVGHLYHHGQGVQQNLKQAVFWYSKALDGGSRDAKEDLVRMWVSGELAAVVFQSLHQRLRTLERQQNK